MKHLLLGFTQIHHLDISELVLSAFFVSVPSMFFASFIQKEIFTLFEKFVKWFRCFSIPFNKLLVEPNGP